MNIKKISFFCLFFGITAICVCTQACLAADDAPDASAMTTQSTAISAPAQLPEKDLARLEKDYLFDVKQKQQLLSPYAPGAGMPMDTLEFEAINKQEKLYRYFGIATDLHKTGKHEEAIEILKYILLQTPDDEYVKSYLNRLTIENEQGKARWDKSLKSGAKQLKENQIKNLLQDGIIAYKRNEFDDALINFVDILAMDPQNKTAQVYIEKLKKYYLQQVKAQDIVNKWESSKLSPEPPDNIKHEQEPAVKQQEADSGSQEKVKKEIESIQVSDYKQIFNYYHGQAKEYAKKGMMEEAYKACRMIFAIVPKLSQEAKLQFISEIEALDKDRGAKDTFREEVPSIKTHAPETAKHADNLLDDREFKELIINKRADKLLEKAELGFTVEEIVEQKREQARRSRYFSLGPGDILQISVRDHPELSGKATVQLNGQITLPLTYDSVSASGLSAEELTIAVTETMKRYVKDPVVGVSVLQYRSKIFYVIDENGATPYPITRANFTIRDALFVADWGTNRALGRVLVIKPHKIHPIVKKVNTFDLIYRGELANNIPIESGDVIYIPMTFVGKSAAVLRDVLAPLTATRDGIRAVDDLYDDIKDITSGGGLK
jgi:protein involved in polysaccharide export with SLBB domain